MEMIASSISGQGGLIEHPIPAHYDVIVLLSGEPEFLYYISFVIFCSAPFCNRPGEWLPGEEREGLDHLPRL